MRSRKLLSVVLSVSMFLGTATTSMTAFAENAGVFDNPLAPIQKQEFTGEKFVAKPLVILMDFQDYKHEQLDEKENWRINSFKGEETTKEFYQQLFFGKDYYQTSDGKKHITVRKFFEQESGGVYDFDGTVIGWYTAKEKAAFYGKAKTDQKQCRDFLVKEAIAAAAKDLDLSKFDVEDKWDLDGDGNYNEPDGIVDSIVVIHPGLGEEWGGGSLGDDAIWPFRWGYNMYGEKNTVDSMTPTQKKAIIDKNPTVTDKANKTFSIEDFSVFEQDLPVDLFCHEFGHVLGLPDLYDADSWSDVPVGNWSIMGGSYTGNPRGSQPVSYGAYCRQFLQKDFLKRKRVDSKWQNAVQLNLDDIPKEGLDVILDQASLKGKNKDTVRIDLPDKHDKLVAQPIASIHGTKFFFSDVADNLENFMTTKSPIDLTGVANPKLSINAWYNLDPGFDFASVQVKVEGTDKWVCLKDDNNLATDKLDDWVMGNNTPEEILHRNPGWGFTGEIKGNNWTDITFDLSAYKGKKIDVRFRLSTDDNGPFEGFYFDNFKVTDNGNVIFVDDAEGEDKFNYDGFYKTDGYTKDTSKHYYLLEWRNKDNGLVDQGLGCVNMGYEGLQYDTGLAIWYINEYYNGFTPNQNVKFHPGEAFATVIDADQNPVKYQYVNGNNGADRILYQMHDSTFGLRKNSVVNVSGVSKGVAYTVTDDHLFMTPNFNDASDYTGDYGNGITGTVLRKYGLKVFVTEESKDRSTAKIHIAKTQDAATEQGQKEIKEIKIQGGNVEITTAKEFAKVAHAVVVAADKKEEIELTYTDGKYLGKTTLGDSAKLEFIILTDAEGNAKAIYNSGVNGVYGANFANLIFTEKDRAIKEKIRDAKALVTGILVSEDGVGLSAGTKYCSKKSLDDINAVIKQAEAILAGEFTKEMSAEHVAALTLAMTTFEKSIKVVVGDKVDVNSAALSEAIKNAEGLLKNLKVSLDKKGMTNSTNFWLQKDYDNFVNAINAAKGVLADGKSTQANVDKAVADIAEAVKLFKAAKQASTPATMDTTYSGLYALLLVISMVGCVVVIKKSKRTSTI